METDIRYERLSTDRSDCLLSFVIPVGVLLTCNHLYNQYIFIDDPEEDLRRFEKMHATCIPCPDTAEAIRLNREWIEEYLNEAHSYGLTSVRCHCNVISWSDDERRTQTNQE